MDKDKSDFVLAGMHLVYLKRMLENQVPPWSQCPIVKPHIWIYPFMVCWEDMQANPARVSQGLL
jgi:hypothetical protein